MTILRPRLRACVLALVVASALTAAMATPTVGAAFSAHVARAKATFKTCDISKVSDKLGPTSVTSLKVLHAKCAAGISVVKAFHSCRLAHGTSGRCTKLVKGYACNEIRTSTPAQFTATVTCRKDDKSVMHRYTQVV